LKTNFRSHKQEPKPKHKQKWKQTKGCKILTVEEKQQVEYALHFFQALINDFPHSDSPNPHQFPKFKYGSQVPIHEAPTMV
jgi:hypothetical protein